MNFPINTYIERLFDLPINEYIERLLDIPPDRITWVVVIACVLLLVFGIFSRKMREMAPALMVSAGIIGTFWGTFIALAKFNLPGGTEILDPTVGTEIFESTVSTKMLESIRPVLDGMKSAFVTSLVGLFFAFGSRIAFNFMPKTEPKPLPIETDTIDLLQEIKDGIIGEGDKSLSSQLSALQAEYRDSAKDLKQSISGDGDSSVTTQLVRLRNENSDGFKTLDSRLDGLAETIRVSLVENMQALMGEIREVIVNQLSEQLRQTNTLLREQLSEMLDRVEEALIKQFGETFKQFNEATQAIKKWQEDHRQQVERLTEAFEMTAAGIERIRADCESIPATMEKFRELMGELDERLKAFANMKESAEQAFPLIKENLDAIGVDLQKSAEGFSGLEKTITDTYTKAGELVQQHIESVGAQIDRTAEQVAETAKNMMNESRNASALHQDTLWKIVAEMKKMSQECIDSIQGTLQEIARDTTEQTAQVTKQVKTASENMIAESRNASNQYQSEMQKIMDAVANASDRCVTDMQKSLEEMAQKHVQITNDAMTEIANRWGENMVSIAEKLAESIVRNN